MDRKKLYKEIQKIDDELPELEMIAFISKNSKHYFQKNIYEEMIETINEIKEKRNNTIEDVAFFLKGLMQATPYSKNKFIKQIREDNKRKFTKTSSTINDILKTEFQKTDPETYHKLARFQFKEKEGNYITKLSRDPNEIKEIVKRTDACIKDDPLNIFHQIANDVGTIYLLTYPEEFDNRLEELKLTNERIGYGRIYLLQNKKRNEKVFGVDNIWFNNENKEIVDHVLEQLNEIGNYFNMPILDHAITSKYLTKYQNTDIFISEEEYYKVGNVARIERFVETIIQKDDAFYNLVSK